MGGWVCLEYPLGSAQRLSNGFLGDLWIQSGIFFKNRFWSLWRGCVFILDCGIFAC
jgi:hypothetical protein